VRITDASRLTRGLVVAGSPIAPALLVGYGAADDMRSRLLVAWALVLAAALLVQFHRRAAIGPSTADRDYGLRTWLVAGLAMAAIYGSVLAAVVGQLATPHREGWPLVGQVVLILVLTMLARTPSSTSPARGPVPVSVLAGVFLTVTTCVVLLLASPLNPSPFEATLLNLAVATAGLVLAWTVLSYAQMAGWVRRRLALAITLFTVAQYVASMGHDPLIRALAILASLQGVVVVALTCHRLLRHSILERERELHELYASMAQVRASLREDRELLHEVGATIAGIATASTVMREAPQLSPQRRQRLEHMVNAEINRLERLVRSPLPAAARSFEVDDVVEPLVVSHQERGLDVRWTPCRLQAMGDSDDLAEVVNILLENAGRHGGHTVWIDITTSNGFVEVRCSDDGPGVASEILTDLFTSGVCRSGSPGQGLGLAIARRLMSARGGSLEMAESINRGATFVARLPMSELADATTHHVA
jgi:signal transduction histidine kinase